ncbi:hypothetical protein HHJ80_09430 [Mobiluncus mulieris]|nr:hypothetical protein [Mobiluncus mulieris]
MGRAGRHGQTGQAGQHSQTGQAGQHSQTGQAGRHSQTGQAGQHSQTGQAGRHEQITRYYRGYRGFAGRRVSDSWVSFLGVNCSNHQMLTSHCQPRHPCLPGITPTTPGLPMSGLSPPLPSRDYPGSSTRKTSQSQPRHPSRS